MNDRSEMELRKARARYHQYLFDSITACEVAYRYRAERDEASSLLRVWYRAYQRGEDVGNNGEYVEQVKDLLARLGVIDE